MHQLTVTFGPAGTTWAFLYKDGDIAHKAAEQLALPQESIYIADDFGQRANIKYREIWGFMVEDLELSKLGHIERGLHQARTQAKAQQMAQADPVIKAAAMGRGSGLATLNPMGNERFS
jgi:hypothetical protein